MKVQFKAAVAAAATATLLLSSCSGGDDKKDSGKEPTSQNSKDSNSSNAGSERAESEVTLVGDATLEVEGDKTFLVATVKNGGSTVKMTSAFVSGFGVASLGDLKGGKVVPLKGNLEIKKGDEQKFETTGVVVLLEFPNVKKKAGEKLRVELSFDDFSKLSFEAPLSAGIKPAS